MSRLERLVLLLDTGTPIVRNTAADQLAEIQKVHPHELFNLLGRVAPYLKSAQWDTRVAAARAIGGIVEHVPLVQSQEQEDSASAAEVKLEIVKDEADLEIKTEPGSKPLSAKSNGNADTRSTDYGLLTFDNFDVMTVVENGKPLLGSAGKEYDWTNTSMSTEERLALAKHDVTSRLGLGAEFIEKDFLSAQDLSTPGVSRQSSSQAQFPGNGQTKMPTPMSTLTNTPNEVSSPGTPNGEEGLSARQRTALKRKARMEGKGHPSKMRIIDVSSSSSALRRPSQDDSVTATPVKAEPSGDYFSVTPQAQNDSKIVVEHKVAPQTPSSLLQSTAVANGWALEGLVELLSIDLFDHRWETRHGAAMALREVLKFQAPAAGKRSDQSREVNEIGNIHYLDDLACHLCCVFALDRFGDYVSDQVVAPIRETVAQTLAALLKHLTTASVKGTFRVLNALVYQQSTFKEQKLLEHDDGKGTKESRKHSLTGRKAWEITHGGMLGLKYLVAVRRDILLTSPDMLDGIVAAVLYALQEEDDDVRAVGAATLLPVATEFVETRPESVSHLLDVLWDCLAELRDDLSASTGSVMDLLAKLCSIPSVLQVMQDKSSQDIEHSFATLVPRLYPFLRHTITSVRRAVLRALKILLKVDDTRDQNWIDAKLLRLVLQNLLLEQNKEVLAESSELWQQCVEKIAARGREALSSEFSEYLESSLAVTFTPIGEGRHSIPLDVSSFIRPSGQAYESSFKGQIINSSTPNSQKAARGRKKDVQKDEVVHSHNIDIPMIKGDVELVGADILFRTRIAGATALGQMLAKWDSASSIDLVHRILRSSSESVASTPHYLSAVLVQEFARHNPALENDSRLHTLLEFLLSSTARQDYSNLTHLLHVVRGQSQALCNSFTELGRLPQSKITVLPVICRGDTNAGPHAFDLQHADNLIGEEFDRMRRLMGSSFKGAAAKALEDARLSVQSSIEVLRAVKSAEDVRINACRGAAMLAMNHLPKKLNPIFKSLMDSVKTEENEFMQRRSAEAVSNLIYLCFSQQRGSAADKLIKNLCAFLCVDTSETPEFHRHIDATAEIYTLKRERDQASQIEDELRGKESRDARIKHRGAQIALISMARRFAEDLFKFIPKLHAAIFDPLEQCFSDKSQDVDLRDPQSTIGQQVVDGLSILGSLVNDFDLTLLRMVFEAMPMILGALQNDFATIRHTAAATISQICKADLTTGMQVVVTAIIPMLADAGHLSKRQGAIEAIQMLVHRLDVSILPYVIFLIVPVLGRMSDSDNDIRIIATTTFASLVKLVPLEAGIPDPIGFSAELLAGRDQERKFIQQMLDGSKVDAFEIPVAIKADLRSYQQDGVNWLAFLNRYQLHGILCDDMGLGKTLQTICIVASDHHNRQLKYKESRLDEYRPLPSLVICPPSLTGHWQHELNTYAPFLRAVTYVGNPTERKSYRPALLSADVVITSYDIARNDVDFLSAKNFNYCVLDEGHIIKNSKAKLSQAVKMMKANHRLILSGTPIQNNVLELWSLFDFLMPGFLGTEKSFHERYAKPIANSRDSKSSSKEQEAGALALEALHKQVLPFLLRRLKEEVLADLPPKIIQDYYCELSPLQKSLYNQFTASQASTVIQEVSDDSKKDGKSHVFQALQYMRKLCNHPSLVLNQKHPKYLQTMKELSASGQSLRDVQHAPKLLALRDLLLDCGIGNGAIESSSRDISATLSSSVVNQHRALIFCQIKDMLDMVENDVLKALLPSVTYKRLDGTTDPRKRQSIVQDFNADPSIDVLLLTTHVGGLGLNLTGADTVIFVEHDWNPMKDLQAMDRAHRIGQKKTVNVYRLITRGTLEEKIMGLQKFKINIASTIVNQQNSGLATMATDQILDLFNVESAQEETSKVEEGGVDSQGNIVKKGQKSVFDDLDALHNEDEYAEFDVDAFVQTL